MITMFGWVFKAGFVAIAVFAALVAIGVPKNVMSIGLIVVILLSFIMLVNIQLVGILRSLRKQEDDLKMKRKFSTSFPGMMLIFIAALLAVPAMGWV